MSDQINQPADPSVGVQMKRKFAGLDPFIPPAVPFAQIAGAEPARTALRGVRREPATRFRANAGASLALVGIAAVVVVVLGSGMLGPKGGVSNAGSKSPSGGVSIPASQVIHPSPACSAVPARASIGCAQTGASSAATVAGKTRSGSPVQIFSKLGGNSSWSPNGTRVAYTNTNYSSPLRTEIVDITGHAVDAVAADYVTWVDDDTYIGYTFVDPAGWHAFLGHVGSKVQSPIPGMFYVAPYGSVVASGGVVAIPLNVAHDQYAIWTAKGIGTAHPGQPAAMSRDGKLLAVTTQASKSDPYTIDIVRTDSGDVVASYAETGHPWGIQVFGFSPDGSKVAFVLNPVDTSPRLGILDVGSNHMWAVDLCDTESAVWLSNTQIRATASTNCEAPADSGVTVTTTARWALAVSDDGKIASASCVANCTSVTSTLRVTIEDGHGGVETVDYTAMQIKTRLIWSPDGSSLLVEFVGPASSNPPAYVVLIRP